jgi:hypothetical protein
MAMGCQAAGFEKYLLTYRFGALLQALKKAALSEPPLRNKYCFEASIYRLSFSLIRADRPERSRK